MSSQTYLQEEVIGDVRNRLSRIEGHVRGVRRMLEEGRDCDEIVTQLSGVTAALHQATIKLLEGHLETCLHDAIAGGDAVHSIERFKTSMQRVLKTG